MRFLEIKKDLYLVEKTIKTDVVTETEATNHIWIYDRSWSMSRELPQLVEDMIIKAKDIPVGDTISLGWFSGEGDYNFILKGFKITEKRDYALLEKAIRKNRRPISCTCFSEILAESNNVIEDLSIFSDKYALLFMTDGWPVVSNYHKEISDIFKAIENIEGRVTSSVMVGYGNYYNRNLMMEMAESFGGALIHNEDLSQFKITISDLIESASESDGKIIVDIPYDTPENIIFNYNIKSKTINIYKKKEDGSIKLTPSKEKEQKVFILTNSLRGDEEKISLNENVLKRATNRESLVKAVYAASCILNQKAKTDLAMEVLATIGEGHLIDQLSNSYTNAEYGLAESKIKDGMFNPKDRHKDGYKENYLPAEDAFCLLDAIELLMGDKDASFYPQSINYKRIGLATKAKEDTLQFKADEYVSCPLSSFSWHKEKLNLSLLAKITGHIVLPPESTKLGFSEKFPTFIYRNYSLVKDGFLNIKKLPVSVSKNSFDVLMQKGVIDKNLIYVKKALIYLNLDKIPVMNRAIAKNNKSAKVLCENIYEELKIKAQLKVLNDLKKELSEKEDIKDEIFTGLSEEQITFLKDKGITKNGFSPAVEKAEAIDFYYAKHFNIKPKGFSSIPKVSDVKNKIASKKKLRPVDEMVCLGLDLINSSPVVDQSSKVKIAWLCDKIQELKKEMLGIRSKIQKNKFAVILGKSWYDEFESREDCTLTSDNVLYTFALEEKKVWI